MFARCELKDSRNGEVVGGWIQKVVYIDVVRGGCVMKLFSSSCVTMVHKRRRPSGCAKVLSFAHCKENCKIKIIFEIKCWGND